MFRILLKEASSKSKKCEVVAFLYSLHIVIHRLGSKQLIRDLTMKLNLIVGLFGFL